MPGLARTRPSLLDEVVLAARKVQKNRSRVRKPRSTAAKRTAPPGRIREPRAALERRLAEALEQQAATSEVLRLISSSPGDLAPVFQAMLEKAVRICEAKFGSMYLYEGGTAFRFVASHNAPPDFVEARARNPIVRPPADTPLGRVAATRQVNQIADMTTIPSFLAHDPFVVSAVELGGYRSVLAVPMLKDNELIGSINIQRRQAGPFDDKQIGLLISFAAQAVIAIENARLLDELRRRTDDLSEALEQQTATSEVLQVISGSPGELAPVFQAMLENSVRICQARFGQMFRCEHDRFRLVAQVGAPAALVQWDEQRGNFQPSAGGTLERLVRTRKVVHLADVASEHASNPAARLAGARSYIAVPMLKEGELIGAIVIYRLEVRPFTDRQIELVQTFAEPSGDRHREHPSAQASCAELLQQQTATADVLKVISSSAFDLRPVFETVVENAVRLCEADRGFLFRFDGELLRMAACCNAGPELTEFVQSKPDRSRATQRLGTRRPGAANGAGLRTFRPIPSLPTPCGMWTRSGRSSRSRCSRATLWWGSSPSTDLK